VWPIDERAARAPAGWRGWPEGKRFALVLTHDVESAVGQARVRDLCLIEEGLGFRSSFNFVPERYPVLPDLRADLVARGFEVGVHGLRHDGKYFRSRRTFSERSLRINRYLEEWGAVGFRSPSTLRNLDWFHDLAIRYDSSCCDTDPFEPQPQHCGTIFPYFVPRPGDPRSGYYELSYTLPQDFTLFVLKREKGNGTWKRKLDWIAEKGGMALINTHPDYMSFGGARPGDEEYPVEDYRDLLAYARDRHRDRCWHVLPRELVSWLEGVAFRGGRPDSGGSGRSPQVARKARPERRKERGCK
jgi:hypothetical protein